MILIIVLSLIVLGFAQNARRNQRETLDRQLSTQAFYAAESGINDARSIIQSSTPPISSKTTCASTGTGNVYLPLISNATIDAAHKVAYTCVLINASPTELDYNDLNSTGTLVPLFSSNGAPLGSITLEWQSKSGSAAPITGCLSSTANVFTPANTWTCGYGVLRYDLVPVNGNQNATTLSAGTQTVFGVPFVPGVPTGINSLNYNPGANSVSGIACTNTECKLTITNLTGSQYYLRLVSIYQDVAMKITNGNGLSGAQVMVDSTGKAQDVLRRIQVRFPINPNGSKNLLPDNALQSTDSICKRFSAMNNYFALNNTVTGTNALCQ